MKSIEKIGLVTIYNGFSFDPIEVGTLMPYLKNFVERVLEASFKSKAMCH